MEDTIFTQFSTGNGKTQNIWFHVIFLYLFPRCSCLFPKWGQDSSSARLRDYQFLSYLEWLSIFGGTVWNQQADCDDSAWCQQDSWWFSRQTAVSWVHISEKIIFIRQTWIISDHFPIVHDEHLCWNQCNSNPIPMNQFFKTYISTVKSEHTTNIPRNIRNIPGYLKIPLISQRMPYLDCLDVQFLCLATRLASAFCATGGSCDHIALAEAGELQSAKTTNVKHDPQDPCMVYILT